MYVSRCALEFPCAPADLVALGLGYEVRPDLATVPPPLSTRGLRPRNPQRHFERS